jgi:hypothetical protein
VTLYHLRLAIRSLTMEKISLRERLIKAEERIKRKTDQGIIELHAARNIRRQTHNLACGLRGLSIAPTGLAC